MRSSPLGRLSRALPRRKLNMRSSQPRTLIITSPSKPTAKRSRKVFMRSSGRRSRSSKRILRTRSALMRLWHTLGKASPSKGPCSPAWTFDASFRLALSRAARPTTVNTSARTCDGITGLERSMLSSTPQMVTRLPGVTEQYHVWDFPSQYH